MPKGSGGSSSENVHFGRTTTPHQNTSTSSTINSLGLGSAHSTHQLIGEGSAKNSPFNDRVYSNVHHHHHQIDSNRTLILSKFFDSNPAYENLCSGCGYGVFEARGELCNFCQYVLNGTGSPTNGNGGSCEDNANIYENICDKCSQLFSGGECTVCLIGNDNKYNTIKTNSDSNNSTNNNTKSSGTSSKKKLKKRLIHSLLGSLKRVKSFNAASSSSSQQISSPNLKQPSTSNRKIHIVHNVDGFENVFSTNQTFDLNRICELKQQQNQKFQQQQKLKSSTSDHHIYGKLRISDEDDHLHQQARFQFIKQKSQSDDYLISGIVNETTAVPTAATDSCDPLYCNASINSHDSFDINNSLVSSLSTSYLHIRTTSSVSEWMTSLRCETHDYYSFGAPDTILSNPKSIPGNFSEFVCAAPSSFVCYPRNIVYDHQMHWQKPPSHHQNNNNNTNIESSSLFADEISQVEFTQQMVNEFKRNLMEKSSSASGLHNHHHRLQLKQQHLKTKRHGIHLKLDDIIVVENKQQQPQQVTNNNNYQHYPVDNEVVVDHKHHNGDDLVWMVGDHNNQQRNDTSTPADSSHNCSLQTSAQAQAIALAAAGLNGSRREPEHQLNKRCCIYEKDSEFVSDILQVFDSILLRESSNHTTSSSSSPSSSSSSSPTSLSSVFVPQKVELRKNCENISQVINEISFDNIPPYSTSVCASNLVWPSSSPPPLRQKINFEQILIDLVLSKSLNKIIINYDISLKLFLSGIDRTPHFSQLHSIPKLKKIFHRFQVFLCCKHFQKKINQIQTRNSDSCCSNNIARSLEGTSQQIPAITIELSSQSKEEELDSIKMTVPNRTSNTKPEEEDEEEETEEPIYQPIWKFKTVGQIQETNITDVYYDDDDDDDHHRHLLPRRCDSYNSLINETERANIEDHDEWESDDEFTFTTKLMDARRASGGVKEADSISVNTIQSSISGSTITGYASSSISTMTLASTTSSSGGAAGGNNFQHHLFRNICIFYSPEYPKIRAILYEYDRNRCSSYFAKQMLPSPLTLPATSSSLSFTSPVASSSPFIKKTGRGGNVYTNDSTPTTKTSTTSSCSASDYYDSHSKRSSPYDGNNKIFKKSSESGIRQILADSVQAWKYLLLDVNYLEDEEDMIVSESQILKAQTIKEMDHTPTPVFGSSLQRFKSVSSGNILEATMMPPEEDKKSIAVRMRNKLQRGYFNFQNHLPKSPKEGKKGRKTLKGNNNATSSLYREDGIQPNYPIFKAPLDMLEMNETSYPNVPRIVVDCIEYIEQKDCIQMDGLYRASGNKVAIDELKQKLINSYIYDPKLLKTDDIHTLTSLLKMFFRELGSPLIPHDTYKCFAPTKNLMEPSAIEDMKKAFQTMKSPNRETLKFLIKHLTTVAHYSSENRMPASNLAIVWGPCILSVNQINFDIGRINTIAKVLIENYDHIFGDNERLVS